MCKYENRVQVLEDLLAHPSSRKSYSYNREELEREYFDSILDLLDVRIKKFRRNMSNLEKKLDDRTRNLPA